MPEQPDIVPLSEQHIPTLIALFEQSVRQRGPEHYSEAQVEQWALGAHHPGFVSQLREHHGWVLEQAGAVLGLALFQRYPGVAMRRNLLAEWFYIEQGKIRSIYAAMYYPDAEAMIPNWPPFDGNWPVQPAAK